MQAATDLGGIEVPDLGRSSLQSRVADEIRKMIVSGRLDATSAISEIALAEAFGISRTPVREALKQLQAEGLVEVRPRVGTFVASPSRRDVVELLEVKEMLDGLAARLMAARGQIPELDQLAANVKRSWDAVKSGDADGYAQLVHEFHDIVIAAAGNTKLERHYRTMINQLSYNRLVLTSLAQPGRPERSVAEHERVLGFIAAKDADGAEQAMRDHVRTSKRALLDRLAAEATASDGAVDAS